MKTAPDPRPLDLRADEPRQLDPDRPTCPACASTRTQYGGRTGRLDLYRCQPCGWTFPLGTRSLNGLALPEVRAQ